jgi:signal transduction histidine kinase
VNLVLNARDAMPEGGRLHVEARRDGDAVLVTVADTGTGIAPAVLPRIFEPFFTTKGVGRGSGLGLSTAIGIVRQHDGELTAASVAGEGATFTVRLPGHPTAT